MATSRLQPHEDRFKATLEGLVSSMDESDRCVVGKADGIGVIKLKERAQSRDSDPHNHRARRMDSG